MISSSLLVIYMTFIFLITAAATWRVSHMINLEDGPFDIFEKFRQRLSIRDFSSLTDEEKVTELNKLNLDPMAAFPVYVHDGSSIAKWFSCHGCISVLVGALFTLYLVAVGYVPLALFVIYAPALSFVSIKLEISL